MKMKCWMRTRPVLLSLGHHPRSQALQWASSTTMWLSLHGVHTQQHWIPSDPTPCWNEQEHVYHVQWPSCSGFFSFFFLQNKCNIVWCGSGGSFLACEKFGKMFGLSIHACFSFFFFFFSFLFEVEISSRTLIPLLMPGSVHSGSASLDDCGRLFPGLV